MILYTLPAKSWPILRIRAIVKTVNLWPTTVLGSKLLKKFVDVSADLRPLNCELFLCDFIHILLNFDFSFFQCSCQSKTSMFQIMNIISFFIRFKIDQSETCICQPIRARIEQPMGARIEQPIRARSRF